MKIKNIDDFNIYKSFKVGERLEICRGCEFNSKIFYGENIGNINFKKNYKADENLNPLEHCIDCNCVIILEGEGKIYGVDETVSYTHLRAHETVLDLVCRLLLEKKKHTKKKNTIKKNKK